MPAVTKNLGDGTQSVLLTVAILEQLAHEHGPVSVTLLAKQIGTSKSRIFRHLQTLMSCGFVARPDIAGRYGVGDQLLSFCRSINGANDVAGMATPLMQALRDAFGHSVVVSRIGLDGVHVLKSLSGRSPFTLEIKTATVLPFQTSAQGKIALAFSTPRQRGDGTPFAAAHALYRKAYPKDLEKIARRGWATAQMRKGVQGLAAPVLNRAGHLVATLGLFDTIDDIGRDVPSPTIDALKDAARQLSQEFGRGEDNGQNNDLYEAKAALTG